MASVVWKYALTEPPMTIDMPAGADVLTVATQDGQPTMWALVDPSQPMVPRQFYVVGTGHQFEPKQFDKYLGTAHGIAGWLVLHVFERRL